jgi:nucleotide-binding universal stress UspA family protein
MVFPVPFRRILIATDFSADSDAAARCGLQVADAFSAEVHFLHVFDVSNLPIISAYPYYYGHINQEMVDDLRARAEQALDVFVTKHAGDRKVGHKMVVGKPANQILEQARAMGAQLIVIGSSGMGMVRELLGSVSHKVIRQAPCPVLCVQHQAS